MISEKIFKDERLIAYSAIDKIKIASTVIPSDNPTHKNGIIYKISKTTYEDILNNEFNKKCARHMNRESIRVFIETKLKKL